MPLPKWTSNPAGGPRNLADEDNGIFNEKAMWLRNNWKQFQEFLDRAQGPAHFSFGAPSAASNTGTAVSTSIPQATVLPETLAPVSYTPLATSGLGYSPSALGLGGSVATGSMTSGAAPWMKYAGAAVSGLSSYMQAAENRKAAEAAAKGGSTTRTPYMSNMLNPFIPYILQEALNIYSKRQKNVGRDVGNYSPLQAILGQFFQNYTNQP